MLAEPIQTTLELGVPLSEVTFCVVDLETTGGSPTDDAITEIGAVKYRGGERLGLVPGPRESVPADPPSHHPPHGHRRPHGLSRATDRAGAPRVAGVLPGGSVFVAHNAAFDFGFLNTNCDVLDYPTLPGPPCAPRGSAAAWSGPTCPT